jgi:AcrR family transcriptional regulator
VNQALVAAAAREQAVPDGSVRAERRQELAQHALAALAELGYARVNLREIATRSGLSLGVIHYHFKDKNELLAAAVTLYKEAFVQQVKACILAAQNRATLADNLGALLQQAVTQHGMTHRVWYDIRAQALFDETFLELVSDLEQRLITVIEQGLLRLSALDEHTGHAMQAMPVIDSTLIYITLDGWFRFYLQRFIMGDEKAPKLLKGRVVEMFNPEANPPG